jgi:hypothetical protein
MCRNVVQIGMAEGFVIVAGGNSIHPVFGLGEDLHGAGSVSGFCEDGFAIEEHQDRFHNLSEGVTDDANACGLTNGANANLIGSDPNLGPLADNGGATQTHALLSGSPAIDAGDNSTCPATDQRGVARPQGSACDIGAYELGDFEAQIQLFLPLTQR